MSTPEMYATPGASEHPPGTESGSAASDPQSASDSSVSRIKHAAQKASEQLADQASKARDRIVERSSEFAHDQKSETAHEFEVFGSAIREASSKLRDEGELQVAGYVDTLAGGVDQVADYLRDRDFADLRNDASTCARQHPELFLGGMFLAGLAFSRFMKASREDSDPQDGQAEPFADQTTAAVPPENAETGEVPPRPR